MEGYCSDFAGLLCFFSKTFAAFLLAAGKKKTQNTKRKEENKKSIVWV